MENFSTTERSFLDGRDLAVALLREREQYRGSNDSSIEAQYREGRPQDNWVLNFLVALAKRPDLAEGFGAVLSDFLSDCGGADVEVFERLTLGEIFGPQNDPAFMRFMTAVGGGANV